MAASPASVGVLEALVIGKAYNASLAPRGFWSDWGAYGANWCEPDYAMGPGVPVAEFWNTVSNVAFIAAGLACRSITVRLGLPTRFLVLAWSIVLFGFFSMAFHASLLWVNQKLEETFQSVALVMLFHTDKTSLAIPLLHSCFAAFGIFNITTFLFCEIHMIGLVILTLWKVNTWVTVADQQTGGRAGLHRAVKHAFCSALLGFSCWITDRLACDQILGLSFNPQLHAWWHLLCSIALYESFVLSTALHTLALSLAKGKSGQAVQVPLPLVQTGILGLHVPAEPKLKL